MKPNNKQNIIFTRFLIKLFKEDIKNYKERISVYEKNMKHADEYDGVWYSAIIAELKILLDKKQAQIDVTYEILEKEIK